MHEKSWNHPTGLEENWSSLEGFKDPNILAYYFQVNQMESMGIDQSKAASAMSVVGVCELVSRIITSYVGDYVKGKILYAYVVFTFLLAIQNAMGSLAYNYKHVMLYGAGIILLWFMDTLIKVIVARSMNNWKIPIQCCLNQ